MRLPVVLLNPQAIARLPAGDEDADEQADSKGDADGFVGMVADRAVGGFSGFDGFFFEALSGYFGGFERGSEALAQFAHFFTGMVCGGFHKFFCVLRDGFEVADEPFIGF